ncbi:MAG: family 78 glycoside hydrolase catalytic domain [Lachnospiraceae bacterium]|nr:family 78 glycoside hydrolase catalytic domain [Lachnospiraceae bacterium]
MIWRGRWICPPEGFGDRTPVFVKKLPKDDREITDIKLYISAMGVYEAKMNGERIGDFIMAPGWTSYERLQYQTYDILPMYRPGEENTIEVTVGNGWYGSTLMYTTNRRKENAPSTQEPFLKLPRGLLVQIRLLFADGHSEYISTDESWEVYDGPVRMNGIYEGEIYDANVPLLFAGQARKFMGGGSAVLEQEGEIVKEHEVLPGLKIIRTPKGEVVIDFGQEITGYVRTTLEKAHKGDVVDLSFAETLDKDGNFYNDNYRGARCFYRYVCKDGAQTYKPSLTFYGFRYIRVNEFPDGPKAASEKNFEAIAVYSDVKQTGFLDSSSPLLNQLFSNFIWGEKDNFLDVPTDCPQRNERLGWTGDVTAVCRAACLNFDMDRFFSKWLHDLSWDQKPSGLVDAVIPAQSERPTASAMWGDVTTVLPWQLYLSYGDKEILAHQYPSMKLWVKYITDTTTTPYLWTGPHRHYGDWLGLDAPSGSYKGSSREWFIASAFYARSTELVIKAGKVLGEDVSCYEDLYAKIVKAFRETYPTYNTQTECVLAAYFKLAPEPQKAADQLAKMVKETGHLTTGFVGTPYLLHVLSDFGYPEIAYDLLLRENYPGWLYAVKRGATTVWEHWDSIMEDGSFWSTDMNSLNHYAYSSVADWVYMTACGIRTVEEAPGYEKVEISPVPTDRLDHLEARLETRHGRIVSRWEKQDGGFLYDITVPVEATIKAGGKSVKVGPGRYVFKNAPDYNAKRPDEE